MSSGFYVVGFFRKSEHLSIHHAGYVPSLKSPRSSAYRAKKSGVHFYAEAKCMPGNSHTLSPDPNLDLLSPMA